MEKTAIQAMLNPLMFTLRAIKDMGFQWIQRYTLIALPATGYLISIEPASGPPLNLLPGLIIVYFVFTL
jgi:hypothetical protein